MAGMLNANGIEAHVSGYYLQGGVGDIAVYDFANVQVADEDVSLALPLVAEYDGVQESTNEDVKMNLDDKGYVAG